MKDSSDLSMQAIRFLNPAALQTLQIPQSEAEFAAVELTRDPKILEKRLRAVGFTGHPVMLDCACGIGHWSIVASTLNGYVIGMDRNADRLKIALTQAKFNERRNVSFIQGDVQMLPFPDGSIDAILCYGGFMFLKPETALKEFARVLGRGGLLYLNVNGIGWYWVELLRRALRQRDIKLVKSAMEFSVRTAWRRLIHSDLSRTIFNRDELRRMLEANGFQVKAVDDEGTIGNGEKTPFYPGHFGSWEGIFEILGSKR